MKSKKLFSVLTVAVVTGGIGLSSISADAEEKLSDGRVTFLPGALTLDKVPSFDFGLQQITTQDQLYNAVTKSEVQVTDLRGSSLGWTLTLTAGKLKAGMKELAGAQLSLKQGKVVNSWNEIVTILKADLIPTQSVKIMNAEAGRGSGVTTGTWETTDVRLDVPGNIAKSAEQYVAELTWTLTDAPAP